MYVHIDAARRISEARKSDTPLLIDLYRPKMLERIELHLCMSHSHHDIAPSYIAESPQLVSSTGGRRLWSTDAMDLFLTFAAVLLVIVTFLL